MNELSRSLLSAAREGLAPPPDVAARVRAKVAASVGAPVAGAAATKSATGSVKSIAVATSAATKTSMMLKLGALAVIVGAVALGVAHHSANSDAPELSISSTHDDTTQPVTTNAAHEAARPTSPPLGTSAPAPTVEAASLSREVELIDQAMSALRQHDAKSALTAMHTFDRETLGHAQMAEEAAAITIEAHCALGDDVGDRLAAFDQAWPSSAERTRIIDACK